LDNQPIKVTFTGVDELTPVMEKQLAVQQEELAMLARINAVNEEQAATLAAVAAAMTSQIDATAANSLALGAMTDAAYANVGALGAVEAELAQLNVTSTALAAIYTRLDEAIAANTAALLRNTAALTANARLRSRATALLPRPRRGLWALARKHGACERQSRGAEYRGPGGGRACSTPPTRLSTSTATSSTSRTIPN
jgi:hypothetical protein